MVAVQMTLAGENQRDGAFAAEFGSDVALREAVAFKQEPQDVRRLGGRDRVTLLLVAFDQQSH